MILVLLQLKGECLKECMCNVGTSGYWENTW
jgi:hypothetical protein